MLVCLCKSVSYRAVGESIAAGARSVAEIGLDTGAGTDCGSCVCALRKLLAAIDPGRVREED